jgi:hypothetical protein
VIAYEVGKPWPHPLTAGMTAIIDPGDEAPQLMLVCAIPSPTPQEVAAMKTGRLRVAIVPSPPLIWIVLDGGEVSFDAPYALGVETAERRAAIVQSVARAVDWPNTMRNIATIVLVDADTGLIRVLRAVSLTRSWWLALAAGLSAAPIEAATRDVAISRDLRRWPQTADMLRDAAIVEVAGI